MGLDIYLYNGEEQCEEVPSEKYSDHTCNKAYLRSSYNDSGFNSVVNNLIGKDLYYIFNPIESDDSWIAPYSKDHLSMALSRAEEVYNELKEAPQIRVITESPTSLFSEHKNVTALDAVSIFKKESSRDNTGHSYSNGNGLFMMGSPIEVLAIVPGVGAFNLPSLHIIYKCDLTYYIKMAEIVKEFIENALSLDDPRIAWSS